jgi:transcriptional regulator with XRE-family HTH domain
VPAKITPWLAAALRSEQGARGWKTVELAGRAGVDRSHLAEILAGKQSPNLETLEKLAEALEVTISALFREAERRRAERGGGS